MGWRFVNPALKAQYGVDTMPQTAEHVAQAHHISREDQDRFAMHNQRKALAAQEAGLLDSEICPVTIPQKKGEPVMVSRDVNQLHATQGRFALCTMCIGVGQGIAIILERV